MSWEIEYEHVDKAECVHRFGLINRSVITQDGEPARYNYRIILGMGSNGDSCAHCNAPVDRGFRLGSDGAFLHPQDGELKPRDAVQKVIDELNDLHSRMDSYISRHGATLYRGPKKS